MVEQHKEVLLMYLKNQEELCQLVGNEKDREAIKQKLKTLGTFLQRSETSIQGILDPLKEESRKKTTNPTNSLALYLNAKENEKERIISCFIKLFKTYKFERKLKVKEYIKLIQEMFPSIIDFSGRKVKWMLKFHINFIEDGQLVDHAKLVEFIENEK